MFYQTIISLHLWALLCLAQACRATIGNKMQSQFKVCLSNVDYTTIHFGINLVLNVFHSGESGYCSILSTNWHANQIAHRFSFQSVIASTQNSFNPILNPWQYF